MDCPRQAVDEECADFYRLKPLERPHLAYGRGYRVRFRIHRAPAHNCLGPISAAAARCYYDATSYARTCYSAQANNTQRCILALRHAALLARLRGTPDMMDNSGARARPRAPTAVVNGITLELMGRSAASGGMRG
ncbi:unnamed protein product [Chrysodeixis includens]|uniref:Uncharacterized protein n=1 Tax=Chrysodeixis includens TaxID=689277 RepID=A0A9N8Q0X7_CHRIL|nr:unnamed protein product [Chrysodeixis includens]